MNLSGLRYFIEIAECKSFTKASERLFVTQPTLSRQIQDLEEELGIRLFVRGRHTINLTEPGQRFLREAKEITKKCDNLREVVRQQGEGSQGSLRIDYQAFLDTKLMNRAVKALAKKNPRLDLALIRSSNTQLVHDLLTDLCDVAFTMRICVSNLPNMECVELQKNALQIAIPLDHPLADRGVVNIEDLANEEFIMLERKNSPLTVDYAVGLCTKSGFSPRTSHYVHDIETSLLLVSAGKGITFLFSRMNVDTEDVKVLDINQAAGDLNCVLAYKRENTNPMIAAFLSEVMRFTDSSPQ